MNSSFLRLAPIQSIPSWFPTLLLNGHSPPSISPGGNAGCGHGHAITVLSWPGSGLNRRVWEWMHLCIIVRTIHNDASMQSMHVRSHLYACLCLKSHLDFSHVSNSFHMPNVSIYVNVPYWNPTGALLSQLWTISASQAAGAWSSIFVYFWKSKIYKQNDVNFKMYKGSKKKEWKTCHLGLT